MRNKRTAERREGIRRMLVWGAIVGIVAGLLAQLLVDGVDEEIRGLVRAALLLPGVIFIAWWMLFPRQRLEEEERQEAESPRLLDVQSRLEKIESTFDEAAVPAARRDSLEQVDDDAREALLGTMRLEHGGEHTDSAAFRVRRSS